MSEKKIARLRRAKRSRLKIRELGALRLSIHRTPRHTYAQILSCDGGKVLTTASTLEREFSGSRSNIEAAVQIGKLIAERAKSLGISQVAFDRSGFRYHGRVKALADAARENGLEF
jgi:large subunit ribosomal protein L18